MPTDQKNEALRGAIRILKVITYLFSAFLAVGLAIPAHAAGYEVLDAGATPTVVEQSGDTSFAAVADPGGTATYKTLTGSAPWNEIGQNANTLTVNLNVHSSIDGCSFVSKAAVSDDNSNWIFSDENTSVITTAGTDIVYTFGGDPLEHADLLYQKLVRVSGCARTLTYRTVPTGNVQTWNWNNTVSDTGDGYYRWSYTAPPTPPSESGAITVTPVQPTAGSYLYADDLNHPEPGDGLLPGYFYADTSVPYGTTSNSDMEGWQFVLFDDAGTPVCVSTGHISGGVSQLKKGFAFSPVVDGCPEFAPGFYYSYQLRARWWPDGQYGPYLYGPWTSPIRFYAAEPGYTETEPGAAPTCSLIDFGEHEAGDGFACVWDWFTWLVVPTSVAWDDLLALTDVIKSRWPFVYITNTLTAASELWTTTPDACPEWLVSDAGDGYTDAEVDGCAILAEIYVFTNTDWFQTIGAVVLALGFGSWLLIEGQSFL